MKFISMLGLGATVLVYVTLPPRVSISAARFLDWTDAFSTQFEIGNDGWLAMHNVDAMFAIGRGGVDDQHTNLVNVRMVDQRQHAEELLAGHKMTFNVARIVKGLGAFKSVDMVVSVRYSHRLWPKPVVASQSFTSVMDKQGNLQ